MKKALVTLLALAAPLMAETTTTDFTVNVSEGTDGTSIVFNEEDSAITLTFGSKNYETTGNSTDGYLTAQNTNYTGAYIPNVQLTANASDYWTLTFSVTNDGTDAITLNGFSFDLFCLSAGGADKSGSSNMMSCTSVLSNTSNSDSVSQTFRLGNAGSTTTGTYDLTTGIELASGDSATFTLKVSNSDNYPTYAGLTGGSVSYKVIPEPATATLSLLALAGLAVRRRRK